MKIVNIKKKKGRYCQKSSRYRMKMQKSVIEKLENKYFKDKKYYKVRGCYHCTGYYRSAAHSISNLNYSVPKKIPKVFRNGSNYDYHFVIKELAEEFKKQVICSGENT